MDENYNEITENDASLAVLEMLGNLARKIASLERGLESAKDQIDVLYRNQLKQAEEYENLAYKPKDYAQQTFRVGSVDYTVELVPKLAHLYELFGQITYDDTNIQIDADLSTTRANDTLIHELLHAVFFEAGIVEQDEDLINRVAHVLAQLLRDNDFEFMRGGE